MKQSSAAAEGAAGVGAGATNTWPPRVLDTIYKDRLQTLYDLLLHLLIGPSNGSSDALNAAVEVGKTTNGVRPEGPEIANTKCRTDEVEAKEAQRRLTREDDPLCYTTMLRESYAVMPETAPTLGAVSFEQRWTQQQIVERVIELQFRQEVKPSHVLCSGYRKLRPSLIGSSRRRAPVGLECLYGNAAVDIVNSSSWKVLLSRVGDLVMLHILSHAAIFTPLPNDCLLQISGAPISSSVSTFRKSSLLHTGEKMLRSHSKRKPELQTSSAQLNFRGTKRSMKQVSLEGSSSCNHAAAIGETIQDAAATMESGDDPAPYSKMRISKKLQPNSNAVEKNVEKSLWPQTSCVIDKSYQAKRKAQETTVNGDIHWMARSHNPDSEFRKRRKLEVNHVDAIREAENCEECVGRTTKRSKLPVNRGEDFSEQQTLNPHPTISDGIKAEVLQFTKFRAGATRREQFNIIPISTPSKVSTNTNVFKPRDGGTNLIQLSDTPLSSGGSFLASEVCPSTVGSSHSEPKIPDTKRTKRVRLPSWKRRKLLRKGEDACSQGLEGGVQEKPPIILVEKLNTPKGGEKDSEERRQSKLHVLPSKQYVSQGSGGSGEERGMAQEAVALFTEPSKVRQTTKRETDIPSRRTGPSHMVINRASIFYSSNFSCHPGLPANHTLNKLKPDEAGADHLHAYIFGSLDGMSAGLSSDPNVSVDTPNRRSIRLLLKQLLARAKRCAYAKLLNRHCPLPQMLNSQLAESSTPFLTAATAPSETQDGSQRSQPVVDKHERENLEQHVEVEEMMKLLLGPMYQPSGTSITKPCDQLDYVSQAQLTPIPRSGEQNAGGNNKRFEAEKHGKDCADAIHTASIVATDKTLRAGLVASYADHSSVVGFLWATCRSIIPPDMLGSKRSWRALRSSIAHFVGLRRHEKFNIQLALLKLKLSSYSWLTIAPSTTVDNISKVSSSSGERSLQQKKLVLWLYWLFTSLVVPLIRSHFYVTEIENHRQNVFYYRKPVWAKLRNIALKDLTQRNYKKLSKKSVSEALDGKALGFSKVRLLPKRTGVRPIANLAAPSQGTLKFRVKPERRPTLRQLFGDLEKPSAPSNGRAMIHCNSVSSLGAAKDSSESFTDFSPQKSWQSAAIRQSHVTTYIKDSSISPNGNSASPLFRAASKETTPCKYVLPVGEVRNSRFSRKFLKSVNFSFRSVNSVLRDAYFCLKLEKDSYPEDLGSSVFGYSDIHSKVLPFILQIKASSTTVPRLYMVVCDVTKAYDSIQQEKLLEIVSEYMRSFDYNVAKYTCVTPTLASVRVSHERAPTRASEHQQFSQLVHDLATKHSHCIFTDQGFCTSVRREKILGLLEEHIKNNIVQMGKQFYKQTVGIPQGSILSSILCSLFYGHFELQRLMPHLQSRLTEKLLSSKRAGSLASACGLLLPQAEILATQTAEMDVEHMLESSFDMRSPDPSAKTLSNGYCSCSECQKSDSSSILKNSVLLRLIDDSFFISTSEAAATMFVENMHMGSEEYGCQANKRKTATSFSVQLGKRVLPKKIYTTEDGACFIRWSGLLVNCYTVEFQADYTRYSGEHIRSTLTVKRERNQGWHLVLKMCQYMRPKCHALFFDPRINSPATIRLNAFQSFLLCAMKFHAYMCCLPRVTGDNQPFLYEVICCTIRYMYGLLRHRMETVGAKAVEYFPFVELEWLAMVAFHRILKRKQSRYRMLLAALQIQLENPKYRKMTSCPHLSSATDEKRSSMFKYIKY
ncbi:telomerase reverse transcriptase [Marchantia polymorpha subsp. ruderalis]|uniref:Telomerase reverse transcriptase n=2 Tax=Marchantia polymorpha TaxID=3197 RepID=A0AAF6BZ44_MARPO|nr:hypothetical protein MARPO_0009s0015 [Marchantia polymorpha]BBN17278.1 hypothetical protein Mp_7g13290 [Marchantia polymorpha subsp. ruderalis]|eukprot:PTQ46884.1 hypothetical protein MARPO_0009s0015 [Marchantia polymorpha]